MTDARIKVARLDAAIAAVMDGIKGFHEILAELCARRAALVHSASTPKPTKDEQR